MIFHARIADVRIGMTMPVMEPNLDAATLKAWARVIDGGPFSSLCWGERIAFDNPECLTLLGALSAWTDRVRLGAGRQAQTPSGDVVRRDRHRRDPPLPDEL
jgi:hypothetical protein